MASMSQPDFLQYKRSKFVTFLPVHALYNSAHFWIARQGADLWRVGFTKFALRMLGEMVDHGFHVKNNEAVQIGQIIGWVEGFKAITDIYCIVEGRFTGSNPALQEQTKLLEHDPYGAGWLYEVSGAPDPKCVDVYGYQQILDKTIDRMLEQQTRQA